MKAFEVCSDKMISKCLGIFIFSNMKTVLEAEKNVGCCHLANGKSSSQFSEVSLAQLYFVTTGGF